MVLHIAKCRALCSVTPHPRHPEQREGSPEGGSVPESGDPSLRLPGESTSGTSPLVDSPGSTAFGMTGWGITLNQYQ